MTTEIHPAIRAAAEIYARSGDLAPHQKAFLRNVHKISMLDATIKGSAVQKFGDRSAECLFAQQEQTRRTDQDLAVVLGRYMEAEARHQEALEAAS